MIPPNKPKGKTGYKSQILTLAASALLLETPKVLANYASGEVKTYETYTYGKFSTRMQASGKNGTVSSFFTYWNGPNWYYGGWNEIDVEVVPSISANPFSTNIISANQAQD